MNDDRLGASQRIRLHLVAHPLPWAILAGLVARCICAWVNTGFFSYDDHFHVVVPAWRWLNDPSFNWATSELPGSDYRSFLFPRLVLHVFEGARFLGLDSPEALLRLLHTVLGLFNLLGVVGVFLLTRRLLDQKGTAFATWCAAVYVLFPFIGTRSLIEVVAGVPLVWSAWALEEGIARSRRTWFFGAGVLIGCACVFRWQVGVWAAGTVLILLYERRARAGALYCLGATLGPICLGFYDLQTRGEFLASIVGNISYNLTHIGTISSAPWYTYLFLLSGLLLPPAVVYLGPAFIRSLWPYRRLAVPFLLFFVFHSAVSHKEERFLFPVLPVFFFLVAAGDYLYRKSAPAKGRFDRVMRVCRIWCLRIFWGCTLVALPILITGRTQANQLDALQAIRAVPSVRGVLSFGMRVPEMYLGRLLPVAVVRTYNQLGVQEGLEKVDPAGGGLLAVLAVEPVSPQRVALLAAENYTCSPLGRFDGWWLDRLLFRLNPENNQRRATLLAHVCQKGPPR